MITEEQIWNYLDGALTDAEREIVEREVAENKHNADLFQDVSALHQSLKGELLLQPSAAFADKVMASVNAESSPALGALSAKVILLFLLPTLLVLAAFTALIVYNHVPVAYSLPLHIALPHFKNPKLFFAVADILLLAFFVDSFLEYRFNRKTLFS